MQVAPFTPEWVTEVEALARDSRVYVPDAEACGLIVAEDDALAGFIVWHSVLDEASLLGIAVTASRRREGLGGRLLDSAIMAWQARGIREIFLEVRASNRAAQALYRSRGFYLYRRRANYYHSCDNVREDALLLRKSDDRNIHLK